MLEDVLVHGLSLVICGMAAGPVSAARGEYYAGRGNKFWRTLFEVGLTPRQLAPAEFRLLPTWGIGLTEQVSGHTEYLHDGRARSLLEAILWHGGEAQAQRDAVAALPTPDRQALVAFLESL